MHYYYLALGVLCCVLCSIVVLSHFFLTYFHVLPPPFKTLTITLRLRLRNPSSSHPPFFSQNHTPPIHTSCYICYMYIYIFQTCLFITNTYFFLLSFLSFFLFLFLFGARKPRYPEKVCRGWMVFYDPLLIAYRLLLYCFIAVKSLWLFRCRYIFLFL